jgi:ornithine--oxo-acid transaminase
MHVIQPGQHGSTFGGNPIAAVVATKALEIVAQEHLIQNARHLGKLFRSEMEAFKKGSKTIKEVRGRGLLNAIEINDSPENSTAWEICVALMENGLLAKPTHGNTIRFTPPLVMTETQMKECIELITSTLKSFEHKIG